MVEIVLWKLRVLSVFALVFFSAIARPEVVKICVRELLLLLFQFLRALELTRSKGLDGQNGNHTGRGTGPPIRVVTGLVIDLLGRDDFVEVVEIFIRAIPIVRRTNRRCKGLSRKRVHGCKRERLVGRPANARSNKLGLRIGVAEEAGQGDDLKTSDPHLDYLGTLLAG